MVDVDPLLSPEEVLRLDSASADRLLSDLERRVPRHPTLLSISSATQGTATVFGDTHGDWRSTEDVVHHWETSRPDARLVSLGDCVDRSPEDCGAGSVANAVFLLGLAARFPDRVILLQGNHELARRIAVRPHTLPQELARLWGADQARYDRLMGLLERGPLAAVTPNGAYLAHAGFPRGPLPAPWQRSFETPSEERLLEIVWAECAASSIRRGAAEPWGPSDLDRFLGVTGLAVVLRGHDPDIAGQSVYGGRVLTLNTTRLYERFGGVLSVEMPLERRLTSVADLTVRHAATEGHRFAAFPPSRSDLPVGRRPLD